MATKKQVQIFKEHMDLFQKYQTKINNLKYIK